MRVQGRDKGHHRKENIYDVEVYLVSMVEESY